MVRSKLEGDLMNTPSQLESMAARRPVCSSADPRACARSRRENLPFSLCPRIAVSPRGGHATALPAGLLLASCWLAATWPHLAAT